MFKNRSIDQGDKINKRIENAHKNITRIASENYFGIAERFICNYDGIKFYQGNSGERCYVNCLKELKRSHKKKLVSLERDVDKIKTIVDKEHLVKGFVVFKSMNNKLDYNYNEANKLDSTLKLLGKGNWDVYKNAFYIAYVILRRISVVVATNIVAESLAISNEEKGIALMSCNLENLIKKFKDNELAEVINNSMNKSITASEIRMLLSYGYNFAVKEQQSTQCRPRLLYLLPPKEIKEAKMLLTWKEVLQRIGYWNRILGEAD